MKAEPSVLQHFREDERPFIERVEELIERVTVRQRPELTNFLNPRQRLILRTLVQRSADVRCVFDGGYEQAEYKRCFIAPDYWQARPDEMDLRFLQIHGKSPFHTLHHRDYLGALLHLGIERDKIGDLLTVEDGCQVVTTREMGMYIRLNLKQVHRVRVTVEDIEREQLTVPEESLKERTVSVASRRLDAVLSAAYPLSRSKTVPLIRSGKCKLNWKVEQNPAATVSPGDTLSLRGYGRVRVLAVEGETKRGRTRLRIGSPTR